MIWGYLYNKHKFLSIEEQRNLIVNFTKQYQFKHIRFRTIEEQKNILSSSLQNEDTLIISDVLSLGSRFEDIITTLKILTDKKVRICSVSEDLMLDNLIPHLSYSILDSCLKIYKGTLSIKNKQIQAKLLETGRERGRPKNKTFLDENLEQLKELLNTDLSITDIAKRMNISRSTLFAFIRRKKIKR